MSSTYLALNAPNIVIIQYIHSVLLDNFTSQGKSFEQYGLKILLYLVITFSIINNESFVIIPI